MGEAAIQAALVTTADASPAAAEASPADLETARLVRLARAGDRDAFAGLVDLHQIGAYRIAMAALGRPDEAEDAAQEAFIAAWRRLGDLRDDERFRPWLMSIVWRKAMDRRRSVRSWLRVVALAPAREDAMWSIEDSPDLAPTPESRVVDRSTAEATRRMIDALPRKLRDPLLLAASGEHRYEEIATMLSIPVGTVKWRVSEARRILKAKLERLQSGGAR